jgi:hypothetical protein
MCFSFFLPQKYFDTNLDTYKITKNEAYIRIHEELFEQLKIKIDSGRVPFNPWTGKEDWSVKLYARVKLPYTPDNDVVNGELLIADGEFPPAHYVTFCRGVLEQIRRSAIGE